jgi:RHS repeat-associated protein
MRGRDRFAAAAQGRNGLRYLTGRGKLADQSTSSAATEGNLELIAMYMYDPYNRRVKRQLTEEQPLYSSWDGWREVAEYWYVGGLMTWLPARSYVWGSRLDELIRFSVAGWDGQQVVWTHCYPQHDHQDSVDMLMAADGTRKEKYEYDPFGGVEVHAWTGSAWATAATAWSGVGNPYLYTGRRFDPETGLGYYRNRYYSPGLGRFLTEDPLGPYSTPGGWGNSYHYADSAPSTSSDPLGLYTVSLSLEDNTNQGHCGTSAGRKARS